MIKLQTKYFQSCGSVENSILEKYEYQEDHSCYGCTYHFHVRVSRCTMRSHPDICVWYVYKKMIKEKVEDMG